MGETLWYIRRTFEGRLATSLSSPTTGDPVFARFFWTPMLIINTQRIARDLLDKKGAIYNSRPRTVLFSELYVDITPT